MNSNQLVNIVTFNFVTILFKLTTQDILEVVESNITDFGEFEAIPHDFHSKSFMSNSTMENTANFELERNSTTTEKANSNAMATSNLTDAEQNSVSTIHEPSNTTNFTNIMVQTSTITLSSVINGHTTTGLRKNNQTVPTSDLQDMNEHIATTEDQFTANVRQITANAQNHYDQISTTSGYPVIETEPAIKTTTPIISPNEIAIVQKAPGLKSTTEGQLSSEINSVDSTAILREPNYHKNTSKDIAEENKVKNTVRDHSNRHSNSQNHPKRQQSAKNNQFRRNLENQQPTESPKTVDKLIQTSSTSTSTLMLSVQSGTTSINEGISSAEMISNETKSSQLQTDYIEYFEITFKRETGNESFKNKTAPRILAVCILVFGLGFALVLALLQMKTSISEKRDRRNYNGLLKRKANSNFEVRINHSNNRESIQMALIS
ncbi:uncharacterized protein LOC142342331 isoform X2 [Convolutriloba macropyga]|uniref:uncharacterized protein LOC142342331 isoform X2 n=1 Tax=Convolutriloba macropyga TaxID=536237 RepID=UPI003F51F8A3